MFTRSDHAIAVNLRLDKTFQPCPAEPDDELYPNGIFEFNINELTAAYARNLASTAPIHSALMALSLSSLGLDAAGESFVACFLSAGPRQTGLSRNQDDKARHVGMGGTK